MQQYMNSPAMNMYKKRERTQNWNHQEKKFLLELCRKDMRIIENKRLDAGLTAVKNKAWKIIHQKFSSQFGTDRTCNRLKEQWRRMKGELTRWKERENEIIRSVYCGLSLSRYSTWNYLKKLQWISKNTKMEFFSFGFTTLFNPLDLLKQIVLAFALTWFKFILCYSINVSGSFLIWIFVLWLAACTRNEILDYNNRLARFGAEVADRKKPSPFTFEVWEFMQEAKKACKSEALDGIDYSKIPLALEEDYEYREDEQNGEDDHDMDE